MMKHIYIQPHTFIELKAKPGTSLATALIEAQQFVDEHGIELAELECDGLVYAVKKNNSQTLIHQGNYPICPECQSDNILELQDKYQCRGCWNVWDKKNNN